MSILSLKQLDTYSYEMNPNIDEELTSLDESMQNMWEEMEEMREETFGLFIKKDKNITIKVDNLHILQNFVF